MTKSEPESFDDVIGRLRGGEEAAAAEIFNRYASRLIRLAHTRLDTRIRQKVDPEDVMQSVFRSFFVRQAKGQFDLEGWDSLWSLLVRITLRKCGRRVEVFQAERRDVRREVRPAARDDDSYRSWEAIAREPTPDEGRQFQIEFVED
jgi:RNA polymerase sigma-70 factor (ECF subfamily)